MIVPLLFVPAMATHSLAYNSNAKFLLGLQRVPAIKRLEFVRRPSYTQRNRSAIARGEDHMLVCEIIIFEVNTGFYLP